MYGIYYSPCCPTVGTSTVPLVLLVLSLSRCLSRTIRLGYAIQITLRPPMFRGVHFTSVKAVDAPCLACGDRNRNSGEGRDRAGPSSWVFQPLLHRTQEKRWVTTNLGPASFESEPSQTTVQNAHVEMHFRVHPSPRLVCSDRPEGCVLSCLDSSSTQAVSALCVRGSSISIQGPALRAGHVSPRLHESRVGSPCSHERTRRSHPQLS